MPEDSLKILYNTTSKDYDLGSYDDFKSKIAIPANRKVLYDQLSKDFDLGDYKSFDARMEASLPKKEESILDRLKGVWNIMTQTATDKPIKTSIPKSDPIKLDSKSATLSTLSSNRDRVEIEKNTQPTEDNTETSLLKSMLYANNIPIKQVDHKIPDATLGPAIDLVYSGDEGSDIIMENRAREIYKKAQALIEKTKDETVDPKETEAELTNLFNTVKSKYDQDVKTSKEKYTNKWKSGSTDSGLPIELQAMGGILKSILPTIDPEDQKALEDKEKMLGELQGIGTELKVKQIVKPLQEISKKTFIFPNADLTSIDDVNAINRAIETGTNEFNKLSSSIQTDPKAWQDKVIQDGIDLTYSIDEYHNKAAKDKFGDTSFQLFRENGMTALEKSTFFTKGVQPYKSFLETSVYESENQLAVINKQINDLIESTKDKKLTEQGEQVLKQLQVTKNNLATNLQTQHKVLDSINESIKTNSVIYAENEDQRKFLDDSYASKSGASKTVYAYNKFAEDLSRMPKDIHNLLQKGADLITGTDYMSIKHAEDVSEGDRYGLGATSAYNPKDFQKSLANSLSYDINTKDIPWYKRVHADPIGLFYNTLNTGAQSMMLGGTAAAVEGVGAKAMTGLASRFGKTLIPALEISEATGGSILGLGANTLTGAGLVRGTQAVGTWAIDAGLGYITPSVLLFGDKMIDSELKKGRTLKEATALGVTRSAIEGLTEQLNPWEMNLIKGKIISGEIKDLSKDVMFKNLLLRNGLSERAFGYLYGAYKGTKAGIKTGLLESFEEDLGLFLNDAVTKIVQNKDETYKDDEPFDLQGIVNTTLLTMATMAPQSITEGVSKTIQESKSFDYSRYAVASSPNLYKSIIADKLYNKEITKEQAATAIQRVENLNLAFNTNKDKIEEILASNLPVGEKKQMAVDLFNKTLKFNNLTDDLVNQTEEEKSKTLIQLNELAPVIQQLRDSKVDSPDERFNIDYKNLQDDREMLKTLDSNYSPEKINNTSDVKVIDSLIQDVSDELNKIESLKEDEQPTNLKTRLNTILDNLNVKKQALESNTTAKVSEINSSLLELEQQPNEEVQPEQIDEVDNRVSRIVSDPNNLVSNDQVLQSPSGKFGILSKDSESGNLMDKKIDWFDTIDEAFNAINTIQPTNEPTINTDKVTKLNKAVQSLVDENNITDEQLNSIVGTGKNGNIVVKDIKNYLAKNNKPNNVTIETTKNFIRDIRNSQNDLSNEELISYNNQSLVSADGGNNVVDSDGNVITKSGPLEFINNRLTFVPFSLATSTRDYREEIIDNTYGLEDDSNTLNTKFNKILDPKGLSKGTKLFAKISPNTSFIDEAKKQLLKYKDYLIDQGISEEEIMDDLNNTSNFTQIDVYDENNDILGNIHTLNYINPSRLVESLEEVPDNLAYNYRELKKLRESLLNALVDSDSVPLVVTEKSSGYAFTDKDNIASTTSSNIKNKEVLKTIQVVKNTSKLNKDLYSAPTVNNASAGGVYIIIPTGNNANFAWQLNSKKATKEIVSSYVTAIRLFEAYKSAKDQKTRKGLLDIMSQKGFENFDLASLPGLKEYLNALIPSSAKTSDFTSGILSQTEEEKNVKFIDFNEETGTIFFSNQRTIPESILESDDVIDLKYDKVNGFSEAGIYEYKIGSGDETTLGLLAEHLQQRRLSTNFKDFENFKGTEYKLPLLREGKTGFEKVEESKVKQTFNSYKEYLELNTETPLLEHKINNNTFAYFQQPKVGFGVNLPSGETSITKKDTTQKNPTDNVEEQTNGDRSTGEIIEEKDTEEFVNKSSDLSEKTLKTSEIDQNVVSLHAEMETLMEEKVDIKELKKPEILSDDDLFDEFNSIFSDLEDETNTDVKLPTEEELKNKKEDCDGK